MKILIINLFLILIPFYALFSQNVTIKGKAVTYEGKQIAAYAYDDLITHKEIKLCSDNIKSDGAFELKLNTEKTQCIFLKTGKQKASLYIQPNLTYEVIFPPVDSTHFINPNVEKNVELTILINDTNEINSLIIDFNMRFDEFWRVNYQYFILKNSHAKLDSFKVATKKYYEKIQNDYFHHYMDYSFASIELNTLRSKKKLGNEYIVSKPIHYDNYEYMLFFNDFFKQYLHTFALSKDGADAFSQINEKSSYTGMMEILAIDKYLKNDTLRELVLLKGLHELYYLPDFKKGNVAAIIETIASKSKMEEHRKIAKNILNSFSMLSGTKAPVFKLIDTNGKLISLEDFKGKYVYLNFWTTWCTTCLQEMKIIPQLKKKYGDKIVFISISIDEDYEKMKTFVLENPTYDWTLLHYENDEKIKEEYNIKTVPMYFLISPEGNFIKNPAPNPSENIENSFILILKPKGKNGNKK